MTYEICTTIYFNYLLEHYNFLEIVIIFKFWQFIFNLSNFQNITKQIVQSHISYLHTIFKVFSL